MSTKDVQFDTVNNNIVRKSIGIFLLLPSVLLIGVINGSHSSWLSPYLECFFLTIGFLLIYLSNVVSRTTVGKLFLIHSSLLLTIICWHTWCYPTTDCAYYKLAGKYECDYPERHWHIVAFTIVTGLYYYGITSTFQNVFYTKQDNQRWALQSRAIALVFLIGVFIGFWYLYTLFHQFINSYLYTDDERSIYTLVCFSIPICLVIASILSRKHTKTALFMFLSGINLLLLLGITLWALKNI